MAKSYLVWVKTLLATEKYDKDDICGKRYLATDPDDALNKFAIEMEVASEGIKYNKEDYRVIGVHEQV